MIGNLESLDEIIIGSYHIDINEFCSTYSVDLSEESWDDFAQVHINTTIDPTTASEMGITAGDLWYGYIGDEGWTSCFIICFEQVATNDDFSLFLRFKSEEATIDVTSITLDQDSASVEEGKTITLAATVLPENATNPTVTWTSSDESIATVADGVVTGISAGTATITAAAGDKTATCALTVTEAAATELDINITENAGTPIAAVTSEVDASGTATLHVTAANPCIVVVKNGDTYQRLEAVANSSGGYDFSQAGFTASMEFQVLLKGDANGDGVVSTDDAMQLARACLSSTHTAYLAASELNQAAYGAITTDLAMQIARSCLSSDHVAYQALTW